jgi:hypothetical protein
VQGSAITRARHRCSNSWKLSDDDAAAPAAHDDPPEDDVRTITVLDHLSLDGVMQAPGDLKRTRVAGSNTAAGGQPAAMR